MVQMKVNQTERIKNSTNIVNLKKFHKKAVENIEETNYEKILETQRQIENHNSIKRMNQKLKRKRDFVERVLRQVEQSEVQEGQKITMKEIEEIFGTMGQELSKVQLNEIFLEMDAGRKFQMKKFEKWLMKNVDFIGLKIDTQNNTSVLRGVNQGNCRNTVPYASPIILNPSQSKNNTLVPLGNVKTFKTQRKTIDYTNNTMGIRTLERQLN